MFVTELFYQFCSNFLSGGNFFFISNFLVHMLASWPRIDSFLATTFSVLILVFRELRIICVRDKYSEGLFFFLLKLHTL